MGVSKHGWIWAKWPKGLVKFFRMRPLTPVGTWD
jgi:hypothetical protein